MTKLATGLSLLLATTLAFVSGCSDTSGASSPPTGGTGGVAGAGGIGGGGADAGGSDAGDAGGECQAPEDCPTAASACIERTCEAGWCGTKPVAAGTALTSQTAGDCQRAECDGAGSITIVDDDTDVPDDGNDCTVDSCSAGTPSNSNATKGTACGTNGALVCNDAGQCVGCNVATDCAGTDDDCATRTCVNETCGVSFTAQGTAISTQTPGDCKQQVCNGSGGVNSEVDDSDVPDDGNPCTKNVCSNGTASNPVEPSGTACGTNLQCNGSGQCVGCIAPSDCGASTECKTYTCSSGTCGSANTASGTPVSAQTAGDCKKVVCNGNGGTTTINDDGDLPVDGKQCTSDVCTNGTPSNPNLSSGATCSQSGGKLCNGSGSCVACLLPTDCGTSTECKTYTCTNGACGSTNTAVNTPISSQTSGDCKSVVCDGNGSTTIINANGDVPVDGKQCTNDVCSSGTPSNPNTQAGTSCTESGGKLCNGSGTCVQCLVAADCGTDTECKQFTCTNGTCGVSNVTVNTPLSNQAAGDCKTAVCDGNGGFTTIANDSDLPVDGKQCTNDVCTNGTPTNPPISAGTTCAESGGKLCDGNGACVQCLAAADCGTDTECKQFTCTNGACGVNNVAANTPLSSQSAGDCKTAVCDGNGGFTAIANDGDVPVDGKECTLDVCTSGVPSNPGVTAGTTCTENGGKVCDGTDACVECNVGGDCTSGVCTNHVCQTATCNDNTQNGNETDVDCGGSDCSPCAPTKKCNVAADCQTGVCNTTCGALAVVSTTPADGATGVAVTSTIAVTFTAAMNAATLTAQTSSGGCSGSLQVSTDDFATCIGFSSATPALSAGDTVATLTPAPGLSYGSTYKIRVTTGAKDAYGNALGAQYTSTSGFTTAIPPVCTSQVVISQVYGGGGNSGSVYKNDFIELHNRGLTSVDLTGWSVQYASNTGSTWQVTNLSGSIAPGGYYLVQEAAGSGGTTNLPGPDATGTIGMSGSAGKVALVSSTTALSGTCPSGGGIVDFVGFGGTANCYEGTGPTTAPSNTNAIFRAGSGCTDTNDNAADFSAAAAAPRYSGSSPVACAACGSVNETGFSTEVDYCNLQFPLSLSLAPSTASGDVFGRIYQDTVTQPAGAPPANVVGQVGFGPDDVNPENQSGWQWFSTTWNVQAGNDDEFMGSFTAPATTGKYRYTYRFSIDSGATWTYCDVNGAGRNPSLAFEVTQLPVLTVQ